jgi:hypothetical protein
MHILNECFQNKESWIMNHHNAIVNVVQAALLKYSSYARGINEGKIMKGHNLGLNGLPDECKRLRPDLVAQHLNRRKGHQWSTRIRWASMKSSILSRKVTQAEVKNACAVQGLKWNLDKNPGNHEETNQCIVAISHAHDILGHQASI